VFSKLFGRWDDDGDDVVMVMVMMVMVKMVMMVMVKMVMTVMTKVAVMIMVLMLLVMMKMVVLMLLVMMKMVGLWEHPALLVRRTPSRGQGRYFGGRISLREAPPNLDHVFITLPSRVHHPHRMNCKKTLTKCCYSSIQILPASPGPGTESSNSSTCLQDLYQ